MIRDTECFSMNSDISRRMRLSGAFNKSASELDQDRAMKALRQFLRPEFINRVDEIVCFNKLSEEDFRPIARLMLDELKASMKEKGLPSCRGHR